MLGKKVTAAPGKPALGAMDRPERFLLDQEVQVLPRFPISALRHPLNCS
jgi:hypothetical protein